MRKCPLAGQEAKTKTKETLLATHLLLPQSSGPLCSYRVAGRNPTIQAAGVATYLRPHSFPAFDKTACCPSPCWIHLTFRRYRVRDTVTTRPLFILEHPQLGYINSKLRLILVVLTGHRLTSGRSNDSSPFSPSSPLHPLHTVGGRLLPGQ